MQKAAQAGTEAERAPFMERATACLNISDRFDARDTVTLLGKAVLLLMEGKLEQALYPTRAVLETDSKNVVALIVRACVLFRQRSFADALKTYQHVLRLHPQLSACDVRMGIGLCMARLGHEEKAKYAFERVLARVRHTKVQEFNESTSILLESVECNCYGALGHYSSECGQNGSSGKCKNGSAKGRRINQAGTKAG